MINEDDFTHEAVRLNGRRRNFQAEPIVKGRAEAARIFTETYVSRHRGQNVSAMEGRTDGRLPKAPLGQPEDSRFARQECLAHWFVKEKWLTQQSRSEERRVGKEGG